MIRGSCLCGAVAFEIDGRVTPIQLCHARRCQKSTGSAFSPELAVRAEHFRWLRGAENLTHYEAPLLREPPPFRKSFCRSCGSPLPQKLPGAAAYWVPAGLLDDDPGLRIGGHVFVGSKAPWDEIAGSGPQFEAGIPKKGAT